MTPEQLARKRANDRNAQRAIRARAKAQISQLQEEIEALKNTPHACCRKLLLWNLELECELAMMKGNLLTRLSHTTATKQVRDDRVKGADEQTKAAKSPELPNLDSRLHPNSEDSTRPLLMSSASGCESFSEATAPESVVYPECGQVGRGTPLQDQLAAPYTADSLTNQGNLALTSSGQVCPTPRNWMADLGVSGRHSGNAGGVTDGLIIPGIQNIWPTASVINSSFPQCSMPSDTDMISGSTVSGKIYLPIAQYPLISGGMLCYSTQ